MLHDSTWKKYSRQFNSVTHNNWGLSIDQNCDKIEPHCEILTTPILLNFFLIT